MSVLARSLSYRGVRWESWLHELKQIIFYYMHLWSHVYIWADFNKLFNKKYMQRIALSQQSINKSSSVTTQRRLLRKHYKGHCGDWIKQVYTKSNLTRVLSMTWTKYETGFPVQETARPWGLSSETCNIVPISRNQIEKIWRFKKCLKD